ncbi:AAA family ATPase [Streptomyces sp. NRRL S-350]|uniref:AAA family ATPase n=1 Tax=Streptomyces sp. NRRL S-350 TaxID=1463902 RepID=UPI000689C156|nr:AAA family ATPase [Streptomyces sp. NRRL S-350]
MIGTKQTLAAFGLPDPSLVLIIGCSGSGKSALAGAFDDDDVLSSDRLRGLVSGDRGNQLADLPAWAYLHSLLEERMLRSLSTVVDATNALKEHRAELIRRAQQRGVPVAAIVADTPLLVALARNARRPPGPRVPEAVVVEQHERITAALTDLKSEGIDHVRTLSSLPLLTVLLRRTAVGEGNPVEVDVEARHVFGADLARLFVWEERNRDGVTPGRLSLGSEGLELRHRAGGEPGDGGFEALANCEAGCPDPAWVPVRGAGDLLAVHEGAPRDEPRCEACNPF